MKKRVSIAALLTVSLLLAGCGGSAAADLRRGVLSEDGIWNALERNRELAEKLRR